MIAFQKRDIFYEFNLKLQNEWRRTNFEGKDIYVRDEICKWMTAEKSTNTVRLLATVYQRIRGGRFPEIRLSDLLNPWATYVIVFAILVSLDYGHLIHIFHKHNITDHTLDWNIEEWKEAYGPICRDLTSEGVDPAIVISEFEARKWAFNPVPLRLMMHTHLKGVNWILPFAKCEKIAEGGTATVYQVLVQEELLTPEFRDAIGASKVVHDSQGLGTVCPSEAVVRHLITDVVSTVVL